MRVKCIKVEWMWDNFGNLYFTDENGIIYYWYTKSDKAFEQVHKDTVIDITSFKVGEKWHYNGEEYNTITNVRFKVLEELIKEV